MKFSILLFLLLSTALVSCTKKAQKGDYGLNLDETLRINLGSEPPTLDWNKATDTTSSSITTNLMRGLVEYDLEDPELGITAGLATEWTPNEKADKWTIQLRKGVKWSDGVAFTAQHVVDGWTRLLSPETASEYAYFLFNVKNAKDFNAGKLKDPAQLGIQAVDDHTLAITLENPMGYFPYLLTHNSTYPIRLDVVKKFGDKWTEPGNIVTLGPYNLKVWDHDKAIVLERNPNFYGSPAKTKYVLGYIISELSTAVNLFDSGRIDALDSLPKTEISALKQRPEHRSISTLVLQYYGFNTSVAPFDKEDVRKAFSHAIDRKEIVTMMSGGDIPLSGWIPAGMFGYDPNVGLEFNVEKAKEYLKKAGYEDPSTFPKVTLAFNTNENHQRIAENVQAQLKKNLGINLELTNQEWKVYLNTLRTKTPSMFRMGWQADYPDPDNFINLMTSYSTNNYTKWKNEKFDQLVEKGISEVDKDKRRKIYQEAQKILLEKDTAAMPLFSSVHHMLVSDRIENYPVNAMNILDFKDVEIKTK